ncbi:MAG: septal ring lytic transglycosylase RlpA family protein [Thiocapsa sp.]|nr:septal ring lytic transglycosylase RlpA family protein [Thiocapsa sp.]MCG6897806.1 septal ring lytic transglycosylase RlpA family protein [Thiocapsa sp.]MCG6984540.1 septal ring lytic transglycosylase RlpA family protein [Thiocapsa sp.]
MTRQGIWLAPALAILALLPAASVKAVVTDGVASYYGDRFHGRRTASGDRFNKEAMTAAHRTLGFGTRVMVTNKANGRSVDVIINDRGPFVRGRTIDLSKAAARELGMLGTGVAPVHLEVLTTGAPPSRASASPLSVAEAAQVIIDLF